MPSFKTQLMDASAVERTLTRLAHEINERESMADDVVLVGIRRRGVPLSERIAGRLSSITGTAVPVGELDIRFYRDDRGSGDSSPMVRDIRLPFPVENKTVILVDDVLYTGRTTRAAIEAVFSLGRPAAIRLAVLVDRGHRELPIRADYVGKNVPTARSERVSVSVPEIDGELSVNLYEV